MNNRNDISYIRVLHAAPSSPAIDVYVNDRLIFQNVGFKEFTPYIPVPKGQYRLTVRPVGQKDQFLISQDATISPGKVMTIAATGNWDDLTLIPYIEMNNQGLDNKTARLRIVHLSPNAPSIDVHVDNHDLFDGVRFRTTTEYFYFPEGTHNVEILESGTENKLLKFDVTLKGNKVYTLYVVGDPKNLQVLQSSDGATRIGI